MSRAFLLVLTALVLCTELASAAVPARQSGGWHRPRTSGFHFFPGRQGPRAFFGQRSFFRHGRGLADPGPPGGLLTRYDRWAAWYRGPPERSNRTSAFVRAWGGESPRPLADTSGFGNLSDSLLLSEGMTPDEVVARIGAPTERRLEGEREVWKYSSFWLLFENGRLSGIR